MVKTKRLLLSDEERQVPVSEYVIHEAREGDLLLWEPTSIWGLGIAWWTGGPFSHISVALKLGDRWFSSGLEEKSGRGVAAPLVGEVKRWSRKISVYRMMCMNDDRRDRFKAICLDSLSASYAWPFIWVLAFTSNVFTMALGQLFARIDGPIYRRVMRGVERARKENTGAICSSHVHRSLMEALGRQVIIKHDSNQVTPNQFALSGETEYVCTLVSDFSPPRRVRTGPTVLGVLLSLLLAVLVWQVWRLFQ